MHIDLETPGTPSAFRSDVCIVGGGIAGILLAARLAQAGRDVHLLEAGGLEFEERSQNLYRIETIGQAHSGTINGRFRTFGGSSTRWGGGLLPYTDGVLHPAACLGLPQWPINLSELEPYYQEVQQAMGVSITPFSDELLKEFGRERPFQSTRVRLRFSKASPFDKRNLSKTLGRECLGAKKATVFTHANVISVDLHTNGSAVRSVTAVNYGRVPHKFEANEFVLCTGTIEASRLLLASTSVCPEGVGNDRDQVGRYFHDHVFLRAAEISPQDRRRMLRAFAPYIRGSTLHKARLEATEDLRHEKGLLSVGAEFPIEEPLGSGAERILRLLRGVQQGQFNRELQREMLGLPAASAEIIKAIVAAKLRNRRYVSKQAKMILHIDVEQRPDRESRIRLSRETDSLGMRKAILDWKISADEHESIRSYSEELQLLFRKHGLATTPWKPATAAMNDSGLDDRNDSFHMMGGTRMGTDPATSVVDSSLKVHGVRNLRVLSCTVFPTGGSSNPTFTMMALALRMADQFRTQAPLQTGHLSISPDGVGERTEPNAAVPSKNGST